MAKEKITMAKIRKRCTRPGMEDCYFRRISHYLTYFILHTKIRANDITALWLLLAITSIPLIFTGNYYITLLGVAVWTFGYLLDHIDGSVARYKQQFSDSGYYLDEVGSFVVIGAFLIALGFGGFNKTGDSIWIWIGVLAMFSWMMYQVMHYYTLVKTLKGVKKTSASKKHPDVHGKYTLVSKLLPGHWDQITYLLIILSIFGYAYLTVAYFAFVYTGMWAGRSTYDYFYSFDS